MKPLGPFNQGVSLMDATPSQIRWVEKELGRLEEMDAVREVDKSSFVSRLFLVPKPPKKVVDLVTGEQLR